MEILRKYDLVIFGASGFTGKYVVLNLHNYIKKTNLNLSWAIAGRSKQKLINVIEKCQEKTGDNFKYVGIIEADATKEDSLLNMTRSAKVIINCSGPFKLYGEKVIIACLNSNTDYVDVSNENQNMEEMQLKYHKTAMEKNIYIVSSCAFDSAVMDLGTIYLENAFKGVINSIETYLEVTIVKSAGRTRHPSTGSLDTVITSVSIPKICYDNLYKPLPELQPKLETNGLFRRSEDVENKWYMNINSLNKPVLTRSQRYFYEYDGKRPAQIENYFRLSSTFGSILAMLLASVFFLLVKFSLGRRLLEKVLSKNTSDDNWFDNPNEYISFTMVFVGKGWTGNKFSELPNQKMITKISATDQTYLYGITADIALLSAVTVLYDRHNMPNNGGVYTPASAFYKTNLLEKMKDVLKYEVISAEELTN